MKRNIVFLICGLILLVSGYQLCNLHSYLTSGIFLVLSGLTFGFVRIPQKKDAVIIPIQMKDVPPSTESYHCIAQWEDSLGNNWAAIQNWGTGPVTIVKDQSPIPPILLVSVGEDRLPYIRPFENGVLYNSYNEWLDTKVPHPA